MVCVKLEFIPPKESIILYFCTVSKGVFCNSDSPFLNANTQLLFWNLLWIGAICSWVLLCVFFILFLSFFFFFSFRSFFLSFFLSYSSKERCFF